MEGKATLRIYNPRRFLCSDCSLALLDRALQITEQSRDPWHWSRLSCLFPVTCPDYLALPMVHRLAPHVLLPFSDIDKS